MAMAMRITASLGVLFLGLTMAGCVTDDTGVEPDTDADVGDASDGGSGSGDDADGQCEGLECDQVECDGDQTTRISGVVHIPSGELPLPNVDVWVPNAELSPVEHGATCEPCEEELPGSPVVSASTDTGGRFEIEDAPAGDDVPVVIQTGKWRRAITVDVEPCAENEISDPDRTRLPRNQSEGTLPRIAVTTGACDALECLVGKLGVDESEFSPESGDGSIHLYQGGVGLDLPQGVPAGRGMYTDDSDHDVAAPGESFSLAQELWDDEDALMDYDIVINSCECAPDTQNKSVGAREALEAYTEAGGRAFLSHWHYVWLDEAPGALASVANWTDTRTYPDDEEAQTARINDGFEDGQKLSEWMLEIGGSEDYGEFTLFEARSTIQDIDTELADNWITFDNLADGGREQSQYMSFNTPVGEPDQCGRVVFSDIHVTSEVAGGDRSGEGHPFPEGCSDAIQAQEKALIYLLFDVGACIDREVPPIE